MTRRVKEFSPFVMIEQAESKVEPWSVEGIRDLTSSDEDFDILWQTWQTIFSKWPIERRRMEKILRRLPGQHYIHEKGFCLSYLTDGSHGKIAAVGVLPTYRGKGLGTAFLKKAQDGLRNVARANGEGELKSLEIGSMAPRFWPQMPMAFPQEVKDFFLHRGTPHHSTGPSD